MILGIVISSIIIVGLFIFAYRIDNPKHNESDKNIEQ